VPEENTGAPAPSGFFSRHRHLRNFLIGILVVVLGMVGLFVYSKVKTSGRQDAFQPFYDTAGLSTTGPLGQVVRSQPLGVPMAHGTGLRILYRTQRADGSMTFSSAMVFIPDNNAAGSPRPVVAWAHGTVGMGDQCAPSRTASPGAGIPWVASMLARGWVVMATDYAGLGTAGTEGYLVGADEANDVLNSVRALKYIPLADAGNSFVVWGHSQGGNSALFTAARASAYAPELHLVATVASAPAAELVPLLNETYDSSLAWVIGPEVLASWPAVYPQLAVGPITTGAGFDNYKRVAGQCITSAAVEALIRTAIKERFFKVNPVSVPQWRAVAQEQTAPVLSPSQPLMVAESLNDEVVLPNTTALYIQRACAAGSNLTSLWLADVGHVQLAPTIAPSVINWLGDRFAGRPTTPTCYQPLPIAPATETAAATATATATANSSITTTNIALLGSLGQRTPLAAEKKK
jgi:pimeloyl-ACP methyl ester carboxylesterase